MPAPIDLYYWPTPNGWKISIALEEMGLPYTTRLIDINKGDQFTPEFQVISPNGRIPAIVDPDGPGGKPVSIFESAAILMYLARKTGQFYGEGERDRIEVEQWLSWQIGHVGPMAGQAHHFMKYAPKMDPPQVLPYAQERYRHEVERLYCVLNKRLEDRDYVAGDFFSIADMALWGWCSGWQGQGHDIAKTPNMEAWLARCGERPGVKAGRALGAELRGEASAQSVQKSAMFQRRENV